MDGLEYGCGRMSPYYNIPQHATMHCPGGWVGIRVLMCADVVLYIYVYLCVFVCAISMCMADTGQGEGVMDNSTRQPPGRLYQTLAPHLKRIHTITLSLSVPTNTLFLTHK